MNPGIGKEFGVLSLLGFAFPTIVMMIFMSLYSIVDGLFIARFVGTDALSASNIVWPVGNVVIGVAIMLATGGSAVVARTMGEGDGKKANKYFTMVIVMAVLIGVIISVVGVVFLEPICRALGSSEELLQYCKDYLFIQVIFYPALMLQVMFQTFFVTAGRPGMGLMLTVVAGVANVVLDYVFIVPLNMGIAGASLATVVGYMLPSIVGVVYFTFNKKGLHFLKTGLKADIILESCANGSSEMVTNVSAGIITFLFNIMMMKLIGSDGVAAITIVLYAQALLNALYMGFSMGVAPVISFNHGSENLVRLKKLFKICMWFIVGSSVVIYALAVVMCDTLVSIFSPVGTNVYNIAVNGFWLFSLSFLFTGINIFASGMFTALSNGKVSAIISFMRTFVFIIIGILVLPGFLGIDGIWLAVPLAEVLTQILSFGFLKRMGKVYGYV